MLSIKRACSEFLRAVSLPWLVCGWLASALAAWLWAAPSVHGFDAGWDLLAKEASRPWVGAGVGGAVAGMAALLFLRGRSAMHSRAFSAFATATCASAPGLIWALDTRSTVTDMPLCPLVESDLRVYFLDATSGDVCSVGLNGEPPRVHGRGSMSRKARLFAAPREGGVDVWLNEGSEEDWPPKNGLGYRVVVRDAGTEGDIVRQSDNVMSWSAGDRSVMVTGLPSVESRYESPIVILDKFHGCLLSNGSSSKWLVCSGPLDGRTFVSPIEIGECLLLVQCGDNQMLLLDLCELRGRVLARGRGATVVRVATRQ